MHTDMQLDKQVIKLPTIYSAEEMAMTQSQLKLVLNIFSLPDKPVLTLSQDVAQPKVVPQISSLEMSETQDKFMTTTYAKFGEIMKL